MVAFQRGKQTRSNCERWTSWKCQGKWHITMTTQQLSCQGCGAWSSEATKQDPDCCSPSGIIAINRPFSTSHYLTLKLTLLAPWNQKSMWHHQPPANLQSQVLPNTVRECILFMSWRFTQGQQLDPDSLMAELPFITADAALWFRLGGHLAQNDWDAFEIFNNALKIREKSANYVHTHTHTLVLS